MILEIILGLMVVIFITESYVVWNLLNKVELLEKNTQENLKLLSDDIHYINNKTNYCNVSMKLLM